MVRVAFDEPRIFDQCSTAVVRETDVSPNFLVFLFIIVQRIKVGCVVLWYCPGETEV